MTEEKRRRQRRRFHRVSQAADDRLQEQDFEAAAVDKVNEVLMPTTSELACATATKTLARPSRMVIVCAMAVPQLSLPLSVMIVPSCGLVSVRPTRCGASRPFSRITRRTRRGLVRTPAKRNRAHNLR